MPTSSTAPWLSPDLATAAGNLSRGSALLLVAVATWWIIPLAERGWTPTDPIQNKPTEVWRAVPGGTAQRVPSTVGTANNPTGATPSYEPMAVSPLAVPAGGSYSASPPSAGRYVNRFPSGGYAGWPGNPSGWAWAGRRFPFPRPMPGRVHGVWQGGFGGGFQRGFFGGGRRRW